MITASSNSTPICRGTLIWYEIEPDERFDRAAVLQCSCCGAIFTSGHPLDVAHAVADIVREGLTA